MALIHVFHTMSKDATQVCYTHQNLLHHHWQLGIVLTCHWHQYLLLILKSITGYRSIESDVDYTWEPINVNLTLGGSWLLQDLLMKAGNNQMEYAVQHLTTVEMDLKAISHFSILVLRKLVCYRDLLSVEQWMNLLWAESSVLNWQAYTFEFQW